MAKAIKILPTGAEGFLAAYNELLAAAREFTRVETAPSVGNDYREVCRRRLSKAARDYGSWCDAIAWCKP